MYAKILLPNPVRPVPFLIGTTSRMNVLRPQLLKLGWTPFGMDGGDNPTPNGQLRIVGQSLQLIVAGAAILDGLNPIAPPGWWEATDAIGKRCMVAVLPTDKADLNDPEFGQVMIDLMTQPDVGAWALLPVEN